MARKTIRVEDALQFAATPLARSTVLWAALAFAASHLVALATEPVTLSLQGDLQRELIHFAAVLFRFVLPFAVMLIGLGSYVATRSR
jgi:hypothetical protein